MATRQTRKQPVKAYEVIAKALDLLGPKGQYWITGEEHSVYGVERQDTFCMIGAVKEAAAQLKANTEVKDRALVEVARALPDDAFGVPLVIKDEHTGLFVSNMGQAAYAAEDAIPDFNDALESGEIYYEDRSGDLRFKRSRRPKGFRQVKKVFCKALKQTVKKGV